MEFVGWVKNCDILLKAYLSENKTTYTSDSITRVEMMIESITPFDFERQIRLKYI